VGLTWSNPAVGPPVLLGWLIARSAAPVVVAVGALAAAEARLMMLALIARLRGLLACMLGQFRPWVRLTKREPSMEYLRRAIPRS